MKADKAKARPRTGSIKKSRARTGSGEKLYEDTGVRIRPSNEQDADLELEFLNHLSPEFRRLRFLGLVRDPSPEVARELTNPDPGNATALIALVTNDGRDHQVGAAHFHVNSAGDSCDCSVTVREEWQKRGVGSTLMRRLIEAAQTRGIRRMRAFAPARSEERHHLASRLGFQRRPDPHDLAAVIYELELQ